jgi:hypothetical protein
MSARVQSTPQPRELIRDEIPAGVSHTGCERVGVLNLVFRSNASGLGSLFCCLTSGA